MLRNSHPVTWLLVLCFVSAGALDTLDIDTRQRLLDVFGDPTDFLDVETVPANGSDCICLPYSRCKVSNDSFYGPEDREARQTSCANLFDWCCEPSNVRVRRPLRVGCGWSGGDTRDNASGAGDNGTAAFGEFPWIVAILKYLKCRAGEWDSRSIAEPLRHQDRRIMKVTQHEGYARRYVTNSVALLFLKTPFLPAPHVGAGCVARAPAAGACAGAGWGRRRHGPWEKYSAVLKKVALPIVDDASCTTALRATHLGRAWSLHASQLCAGAGAGAGARSADTCTGDGGGPLVCPIGSAGQRYAIFGMTAWGVGCGERPAVYVKMSRFHAWLGDVLEANGLDSSSYQYDDEDV